MTDIGRNQNTSDTATVSTVTINSVTATTIAIANPDRIYIGVDLEPDSTDVEVFIRLYPSATDNVKHGRVLTRKVSGNDGFFKSDWEMTPDNIYNGEISAISGTGTFDIFVTEY